MYEVSSISHFLFGSSPVKRQEEKNSLERKHEIICFMFRNNFFHKNIVGEGKKKNVGLQNLMFRKRYFQTKEKSLTARLGIKKFHC